MASDHHGSGSALPYIALLQEFVAERISPDELERRYIDMYLNDSGWPQPVFEVLDGFFYAVDDYVPEERLLGVKNSIDGEELRRRARRAVDELRGLARESS